MKINWKVSPSIHLPATAARIVVLIIWMAISCVSAALAADGASETLQKYSRIPLSFERHDASEFVARGEGYVIDLRGERATIDVDQSARVGLEFVGGRHAPAITGKELPGKVNYIYGSDPRRWRTGIPTFERVTYSDVYPGVDVVYYGNQKQLEFDLVLKPGANLQAIRMRFSGAGKPAVDDAGSLVLGELRLNPPLVSQDGKLVSAHYAVLKNGDVGFDVGAYDHHESLVIDPTLVYSTRMGGGNSNSVASGIALDTSGNAYIAGYTAASDFPSVAAAFGGSRGQTDAFISKMDASGTALLYSTYVGGSGADSFRGIAVDSTGAVWAAGYTTSGDFPLLNPYQGVAGGFNDAVVVKLAPDGTFAYSTFLGGSGSDIADSVAVDASGNALVSGLAASGFPVTAGVYQTAIQGSTDAFVAKFGPSGSLLWSTFFGGTGFDEATGIGVDSAGNAYITGQTSSASFLNVPPGGAQTVNRGANDAFVAKFNGNASALAYFTFFGGTGSETANGIAVDLASGQVYISGTTNSTDLSISAGAFQSANGGGFDGFAAKLNAAGSTFLYATYLGGSGNDVLSGIGLDPSGNAYVIGYSHSRNFPTNSPVQSAIQGNATSLFRTSNGGISWAPFDTNLPSLAQPSDGLGISPDPVNAGTIVASTEAGIYRTTNGGVSWSRQFSTGLPSNMKIARSRAISGTLYGITGFSVYQSTDNGVSWALKGSAIGTPSDIIADPLSAATAYLIATANPAVQRTVNNGATWTAATAGLPAGASISAMTAGSDGSLYLGIYGGGVYKSTNGGASWVLASTGLPANLGTAPRGLVAAPSNPSVLYLSDYFNLYKSTDAAATWTLVGALPGGTAALAVSELNPATLYFAEYSGAARLSVSSNSGVTWNAGSGLGPAGVVRIVPDPANAAVAYALALVNTVPVVAKLNGTGQSLLYSTYLGDGGYGYGIATNGTGDAFVTGYVTANPYSAEFPVTPSALQKNRTVSDAFVARISDATAACTYSVDPPQSLELWYTHFIQFAVTAPSGCPWTASSNQSWATISTGASGSGSGVVYVLAGNNGTASLRTATLSIAGQSVALRQRSGYCGYNTFSPVSLAVPAGGATVQFGVSVFTICDWTITNNDPTAITIVSGDSGTGNGAVILSVAPNLGPNARTFIVASPQGGSETITQAGTGVRTVSATISSSPSGASVVVTGSAACLPGAYTTPASLTWTANTNCTVEFTSPQTIAGTPYVFSSGTVNSNPAVTANPMTVNSGANDLAVRGTLMAPDTTAPSIPANLSAAVVSPVQIFLSWNASTDNVGVTGYNIYRGGVVVGGSTTNSYSDADLAPATQYTYRVAAFDAANNNSAQSASVQATTQATTDFTAPVPGNLGTINTSNLSFASLTLTWNRANDNVSSQAALRYQVYQSTSNNIGTVASAEANGTIVSGCAYTANASSCPVANLSANTTYFFNVIVKDEVNNKAAYVTRSQSLSDIIPPVVALTVPLNGAAVTGTIFNVRATASDNSAVLGVQFKLDGVNLLAEDTTPLYFINWDTTTASNGLHTLSATARDPAGNQATSSITVLVGNAPTSGLVGYWKFDGGIGTIAVDSSPSVNTGTLTNGPVWIQGKLGGALSFDGANDRVRLTSDPTGSGAVTVCSWMNTNSLTSWQHIISNDRFLFGVYSSGNRLLLSSDGSHALFSANNSITAGAWYHACAVRTSDGTGSIWINGAQSGISGNVGLPSTGFGLAIGDHAGGGSSAPFSGSLDEVRIYNRALSAAEILSVYIGGGGTPPSDRTPPSAPANLTATAVSPFQINLSWTASTDNVGVTGYNVYRGGVQLASSATTSYSDTSATPLTQYTYTVTAADAAANNSGQSPSAQAATPATSDTTPPVPGGSGGLTTSDVRSARLTLNWTKATDNSTTQTALQYQVYQSASNNIGNVNSAESNGAIVSGCAYAPDVNFCTVPNLIPNTTYYFEVIVKDAAGNKAAYAPASQVTPAVQSCSDNILTDFSAGIGGNALTVPELDSSTFGITGPHWSLVNPSSDLTFSSSAHHPSDGLNSDLCAKPWPGDTGSVGVNLFVPDSTPRLARMTLPNGVASSVTAGMWFKTDYPANSLPNIDIFTIWAQPPGQAQSYSNVPFYGSGGGLSLRLEVAGIGDCNGTGLGGGGSIPINSSTWYWITIRYSSDTSGAVQDAVRVYDANLDPVGTELRATSCNNNPATSVSFGSAGPGLDYNHNFMFDKLTVCYTGNCPYPLLPAPPVLSSGSPSGVLPAGTTQTTLSVTSGGNATCRYSTTAGTSYSSMTNTFSVTGTTSHTTNVAGLANGNSYTYYVRCQDGSNSADTTDYPISFSVAP